MDFAYLLGYEASVSFEIENRYYYCAAMAVDSPEEMAAMQAARARLEELGVDPDEEGG